MHTSISPSGAKQWRSFLRQSAQHRNDFALDGRLTLLNLPAMKIGSIVSNREFEITHAGISAATLRGRPRVSAPGLHRHGALPAKRAIIRFIAFDQQFDQRVR